MAKRIVKILMNALAIAYIPILFILPIIMEDKDATIVFPYILILIILFAGTIPFYIGYVELCKVVNAIIDKKERTAFQKLLTVIGGTVAVLLIGIFLFSVIKEGSLNLDSDITSSLAFVLAGVLVLIWIIEAVVGIKTKSVASPLKDRWVWISALIVTAVVLGAAVITEKADDSKNKPDPEAPIAALYTSGS